ncbi:MAG: hypothetical protein JXR91_05865 [Deltaproteobacteria bacterium]|nr:hypothetical protein [Deltaproteobacteria bacterium]
MDIVEQNSNLETPLVIQVMMDKKNNSIETDDTITADAAIIETSDSKSAAELKLVKPSIFPSRPSIFPSRPSIFPSRQSYSPRKIKSEFSGSPSVPPPGIVNSPCVEVKAPGEMRFLMIALLFSIILFSVFYWDSFGVINQKLVILFNLIVFVGTIDYFQKVYLFKGESIERRILFKWFTYTLPRSFSVKREISGAVVLIDNLTEKIILTIGRDLANDKMMTALKELYQFSESSFEIR